MKTLSRNLYQKQKSKDEDMSLPRLVITNMDYGKEMLKSGDLQKQSSVHNIHFIYYSNDCPTINCGKQAQPEHPLDIWIAIFFIKKGF